jgi:hypothetical protein
VLGLSSRLVSQLQGHVDDIKTFSGIQYSLVDFPKTPSGIWCWCRGDEHGEFVR